MVRSSFLVWLCWVQGVYCLVTGVWPLVSIETFQMVTGRKTDHLVTGSESDHWLVNTVGVLVTANAVVFLAAALRKQVSIDVAILAIASAAGLTAIDTVYVFRGTISPVYLVDAALEVVLAVCWLASLRNLKDVSVRGLA
jgi:hypothetical protein